MQLVSTSNRFYKDSTSEIGQKYYISRDIIYLYFNEYNCEILINDELFKGNVHTIEELAQELALELAKKQQLLGDNNRDTQYKCMIFTNCIDRATRAFKLGTDNAELLFAQSGNHTKGKLFKVIAKELPFVLINMLPLCCNNIDNVAGDGVYKIKQVMDFNCRISGCDIFHLGQTIGRNIEKMEGALVREQRKKNKKFYLPRLFAHTQMCKIKQGQLVRNYNLLQCCNMAGLLLLSPEDTYKVIPNVISFDIVTAYMSVMICQPIFPGDLTVIDIDTSGDHTDYLGRSYKLSHDDIIADLMERIERLEARNKWYYLAIDPCYEGDSDYIKQFLAALKPFRRSFVNHPGVKLEHVHQEQMVCFLLWDKLFYEEFYSIYMERSFEELLVSLLTLCPDCKITLMYSKQDSDYLPREFRESKMRLYKLKEQYLKGSYERDVSKLYTELTYGKGLQLHDFKDNDEVHKHITVETINIAQSLTCCSFIRYHLLHDWQGFTPVYADSDSVKFQFGQGANSLPDLMLRYQELEHINKAALIAAGFPNERIGLWQADGIYQCMLFLAKKCYLGKFTDGKKEITLSGCLMAASENYFRELTPEMLIEIAAAEELTIPQGKRHLVTLSNNEFSYYEYEDVTYTKSKP